MTVLTIQRLHRISACLDGKLLYCPECGNYLMAGDGECHDCVCGWKQEGEQ